MDRKFEGTYDAPEMFVGATRGKIVLYFLADMFAANTQINHPYYCERIQYTRETMSSMLSFVGEKTTDLVFKSLRNERKVAEQARVIFEKFHNEKIEELEKIFYRGVPLTKLEMRSAHIDYEDTRMAALVVAILDYEEELQKYIQKMRTPRCNRLPRP